MFEWWRKYKKKKDYQKRLKVACSEMMEDIAKHDSDVAFFRKFQSANKNDRGWVDNHISNLRTRHRNTMSKHTSKIAAINMEKLKL